MANDSSISEGSPQPIVFGRRFAHSETFKALFREGMALVEEAAIYLDGAGRDDSRGLSRTSSLGYAAESMRLTTRLMQVASWLLLQRAANDGDMTAEQASQEKSKVRLRGHVSAVGGPGWEDLPARLRTLIERSVRLQERVIRLDDALAERPRAAPAENPVGREFGRVARAFGTSD